MKQLGREKDRNIECSRQRKLHRGVRVRTNWRCVTSWFHAEPSIHYRVHVLKPVRSCIDSEAENRRTLDEKTCLFMKTIRYRGIDLTPPRVDPATAHEHSIAFPCGRDMAWSAPTGESSRRLLRSRSTRTISLVCYRVAFFSYFH